MENTTKKNILSEAEKMALAEIYSLIKCVPLTDAEVDEMARLDSVRNGTPHEL